MSALSYQIHAKSGVSNARLGTVTTPHGSFETPAFMTVGTKATVKGLMPGMVRDCGAQIVLNNTYHLAVRPGHEVIRDLGGVHRVMNWHGPILTDSGGFQAYSMADTNRVDDAGVRFKNPVSGSEMLLGPEQSMEIQNALGSDIIMAMDDCPPAADPLAAPPNLHRAKIAKMRSGAYDHARRLDEANERTVRWLERCAKAHARDDQALFGIVQGGTDLERRKWSAERVCGIDLPGYAIGGVAVGESVEEIHETVRAVAPMLPDEKPRYLMGVGYPVDLVAGVLAGVDMFDCVLPTRNGRNANAFTAEGQIRLKNARYERDPEPLEPGCDCPACDSSRYPWAAAMLGDGPGWFSRGAIRHYFRAEEMLGPILISLHNIRLYQRLMADVRSTIRTDDWAGLAGRWPCVASAVAEASIGGGVGS